jgi:type I restriction enzyme M protein
VNKAPDRCGKVLFINAVNEVTRERAQSFLEEDHILKILEAYQSFTDIDGFAHVAMLEEMRANQANLNIPLYIRSNGKSNGRALQDEQSLAEVIAEWQESSLQLRASMNDLFALLEGAGFDNEH